MARGGKDMFQEYYAEYVNRDRDREKARHLAVPRSERAPSLGEERAVLSTDWSGWNWRRIWAVLGAVGVALVASVALPASVQGAAWSLRAMLDLVIR